MRPFRCTRCGDRFRRFSVQVTAQAFQDPHVLRSRPKDHQEYAKDSQDLQEVSSEMAQIEKELSRKGSGPETAHAGE